jgi:ribonuclease P protein subunit RPR2
VARRSQSPETRRIARERIAVLFEQAGRFFPVNPAWSDRCVEIARRIAMKQRIRIDREYRRRFCRNCGVFLVPGANMRVRVQRGRVIVTCRICRHQVRFMIRREHEEKA